MIENLQKSNTLVREAAEIALFSFFTQPKWFEFFDTSVVSQILLPIIGAAFVANATLQWVNFAQQEVKTKEQFIGASIATVQATLIATAIIGKVAVGAFAAGPFLFLAGLGIGILHNLALTGVNFAKGFKAEKGSDLRSHHLQAAIRNLVTIATLALVIATISTVMIVPAGPAVMLGLATTTVVLTALNFLWNTLSKDAKNPIKQAIGIKPKISQSKLAKMHGMFEKNDSTEPLLTPLIPIEESNTIKKQA